MSKSRFYYGYVIVAAATLIMTVAFGTFYSYTVFFDSFLNEFHWSHAVTSGAFSISNLVIGFFGIMFGRVSDRLGPRKICVLSGIFLGSGYLLMSQINAAWQIYLLYGLLMAAGIGGLWPSLLSTLAKWFKAKRGTVTGIATAGIGVGTMIFPPVLSNFVINYNWRNTYLIIGLLCLGVMISMALLVRPEPRREEMVEAGLAAPGKTASADNPDYTIGQALATRQFWLIVAIYVLFGVSQFSVMVHIVPFANEEGISTVASAGAVSIIGIGSIFSRVMTGVAADRIRVKRLLFLLALILLVAFIWMNFAHQAWSLYVFGLIFGISYGGSSTITALLAAELFGLRSLGILIGTFGAVVSVGGAIGPIVVGHIFDVTGSYQWAFLVCSISAVVCLVMTLTLPATRKKAAPAGQTE
jgi:MFS transporter, OFA family, oxalate/formate antiporter